MMTEPWALPQGRIPHRQPRLRAQRLPANGNLPENRNATQLEMMKPETSFNVKKMVVEVAGGRSAQAKEKMSHDRVDKEMQTIMILEMPLHEFHKYGISSMLSRNPAPDRH